MGANYGDAPKASLEKGAQAPFSLSGTGNMGRVAVFVDAGYFWVQSVHIIHGKKVPRDQIAINFPSMRSEFLDEIKSQFPVGDLLRIYWYDGPGPHGKTASHTAVEQLDDFKLRLGTRNGAGDQKAVDGLIIADLIGLAQSKSISDAILISGDADLTPGVQAAQSLGIRVHLLSMGPTNATSPFLKAEVDQKKHWDETTVKKFISAASASPTAQAAPAALPITATPVALTGNAPALAAPPTVAVATPTTTPTLVESAKSFFDSLADKAVVPKTGTIPQTLDAKLLSIARKSLGRSLTDPEKRILREELKKLA